jgi:FkbM family methyltransferase
MRGEGFVRRARNGLSPGSQIAAKLGRTDSPPRFTGVRLSAPDRVAAWGITRQIADGEYAYPGLTPGSGDRVIDIGANIGVYSLWAERHGAVVTAAYEPGPDAFKALQDNVAGRRVTPVQAAVVGDSNDRLVDLFLHDERSTRNTLLGREIGSGSELTRKISVSAVPISDVLTEPCDLLKLDCEGAEFDIITAASDEQLRRAMRIVVEFHRIVGDPGALLNRLRDAGFDAQILSGADPDEAFGVIGAARVASSSNPP